jgi:hypothetical protein
VNLNKTDNSDRSYWHVALTTLENGKLVINTSKAITFIMPAAKIPDSLDKKSISDAVLAEGKIVTGSVEE